MKKCIRDTWFMFIDKGAFALSLKRLVFKFNKMLKLDVSNISSRSDREATAGTLSIYSI